MSAHPPTRTRQRESIVSRAAACARRGEDCAPFCVAHTAIASPTALAGELFERSVATAQLARVGAGLEVLGQPLVQPQPQASVLELDLERRLEHVE